MPHTLISVASLGTLKRLLDARRPESAGPGRPFRAWVPQCSTGEGSYAVAIHVLEAMGKRWREIPLHVFSTDSDQNALCHARTGRYQRAAFPRMSRDRLRRYFVEDSGGLRPRPFVRAACRFIAHSTHHTPPFSRLDLIACRTASLPEPALDLFHGALSEGGLLFDKSGRAEGRPELFAPIKGARGFYAARPGAGRPSLGTDARLVESEERFKALFSEAEEAIFVLDIADDSILDANEAAARLHGFSRTELLRMRGRDLLASPKAVRRPGQERRSEERLSLPHHRRKDGAIFPADGKTTSLILRGRPAILWMVRDATDRLRARSVDANRGQQGKQEAFVDEVVHELRAPVAVIRGFAETLRSGVGKPTDRADFLRSIENQTARMGHLVDRLLDLSVAASDKRAVHAAPVPVAQVLWEIASAFAPIAKRRRVRVKIDVEEGLAALADASDLAHICGNLIDNAIKFNRPGGLVTIRGASAGGQAIVSVEDTGIGVPPEDLSRVFERFYRSERSRKIKGTGLGLAIVCAMVKANAGKIWLENAPKEGTIFHVALPKP